MLPATAARHVHHLISLLLDSSRVLRPARSPCPSALSAAAALHRAASANSAAVADSDGEEEEAGGGGGGGGEDEGAAHSAVAWVVSEGGEVDVGRAVPAWGQLSELCAAMVGGEPHPRPLRSLALTRAAPQRMSDEALAASVKAGGMAALQEAGRARGVATALHGPRSKAVAALSAAEK